MLIVLIWKHMKKYSIERLPFRWNFPWNWQKKAAEERFPNMKKKKEHDMKKGKQLEHSPQQSQRVWSYLYHRRIHKCRSALRSQPQSNTDMMRECTACHKITWAYLHYAGKPRMASYGLNQQCQTSFGEGSELIFPQSMVF